jgi:cyclophilin family peptidyl-prolyl cis-trans isomerase
MRPFSVAAALPLVLVVAAAGCGGSGSSGGEQSSSVTSCQDVEAPDPKPDGGQTAPTEPLDASLTHVLVFETSCGSFEVTLDLESAPDTAASLVALTKSGFFDKTIFHRVVPGFVIQAGDPTGAGAGGPGYQTVDPPPSTAAYTRGVVAMAKTTTEPAGTAGSQFFVVTAEDAQLPPDYAIVGEVTKGYETVERIDALGDPATQLLPSQTVLVERVTVRTS